MLEVNTMLGDVFSPRIEVADNLEFMKSIGSSTLDLIYCDILYGTGRNFGEYQDLKPIRSEIESHYIPRIKEMKRILKDTGTMTFINCFYSIGDYENTERALSPQLSILSGSTQLLCNNRYRPFQSEDGSFLLSLNSENDLTKPPDSKNVLHLKYKFPGTILSVKFCLNEAHIQKKLESNGNN